MLWWSLFFTFCRLISIDYLERLLLKKLLLVAALFYVAPVVCGGDSRSGRFTSTSPPATGDSSSSSTSSFSVHLHVAWVKIRWLSHLCNWERWIQIYWASILNDILRHVEAIKKRHDMFWSPNVCPAPFLLMLQEVVELIPVALCHRLTRKRILNGRCVGFSFIK